MEIRRSVYPVRKPKEHVIDEISFSKNYIVCLCSFRGTIPEYDAHRRAMGKKR